MKALHARLPIPYFDCPKRRGHLEDAEAAHLEQGGDEAMESLVEDEIAQALAPEGAKGAAAVLDGLVTQGVADPIRHPGRRPSDPGIPVRALHAPPRDGVPLVQVREHPRDVVRVVLEVGVHDDHPAPAHRLEARIGGRRLARVGLEADEPDPRVLLAKTPNDLCAPVAAAVVHEDDLVAETRRIEDLADLRPEEGQILLLVVDGHDDGEIEGTPRQGSDRAHSRGGRRLVPCHSPISVCGIWSRSSTRASVWSTRSSICLGRW